MFRKGSLYPSSQGHRLEKVFYNPKGYENFGPRPLPKSLKLIYIQSGKFKFAKLGFFDCIYLFMSLPPLYIYIYKISAVYWFYSGSQIKG